MLFLGTDNLLRLGPLTNELTGAAQTTATVTATVYTLAGATVGTVTLDHQSAGTYAGILPYTAGITAATTYQVDALVIVGANRRTFTEFVTTSGVYSGRYTSTVLLYRRFGTVNVREWSETEGGMEGNAAAVADAIAWAEDTIDAYFGGSPYAVPFTATGSSLPRNLIEWATVLAGWWLYTKRGLRADDKTGNQLTALKEAAEAEMARYRGGFPLQLQGVAFRTDAPSLAVTVVDPRNGSISDGASLSPTGQSRYAGVRHVRGGGWVVTP